MSAVKALGSILYTENPSVINQIVNGDYFRRIYQVIERYSMQDVPGAVEIIKDCFWGLSNIVLSDEQA